MPNRSKDLMRMDRRLLERPGWISPEEVDQELAALPDVSDKIDQREDEPEDDVETAPAPAAEVAAPPPTAPGSGLGGGGEFGGGGAPPSSI